MWSLPDIKAMNNRAAASQRQFKRELRRGVSGKHPCENCGNPSVHHWANYDVFSDDIKGVTHLCEDCYQRGLGDEGFFDCDSCGRRMIENITWERYCVDIDDQRLCLACAAKEYFADEDNWIDSKLVKQVVLMPYNPKLNGQNVPLFDPASGVLNIARCRHVLGVGQPVPEGIKFLENAEFDSLDGHQISGRRLLDIIQELDEPFCPVLDAAYEFAVSIGIYVQQSAQMPRRFVRPLQEAA